HVMYFETGQGSALSANAHHGVDQQTCEARAYAVARRYQPLLVNTVVGFIGPEYLYDGKQIIRAGLEDHFCGKLLGLPMGCDICFTNHSLADQDDVDTLLTLLGASGVNFVMGVPGGDDVMLNYQSTSYHDQLYARELLGAAHARARAAVHGSLHVAELASRLSQTGLNVIEVASLATSREMYLQRPDLGRLPNDDSLSRLRAARGAYDLAMVIADGLSPAA